MTLRTLCALRVVTAGVVARAVAEAINRNAIVWRLARCRPAYQRACSIEVQQPRTIWPTVSNLYQPHQERKTFSDLLATGYGSEGQSRFWKTIERRWYPRWSS